MDRDKRKVPNPIRQPTGFKLTSPGVIKKRMGQYTSSRPQGEVRMGAGRVWNKERPKGTHTPTTHRPQNSSLQTNKAKMKKVGKGPGYEGYLKVV